MASPSVSPSIKPHGVVGPPAHVLAQSVHGDDGRVLQPAVHLSFEQEPRPAVRVVSVPLLNLLEGDLAVQFGILGDVDLAQATLGVWPENPVARADRGVRCLGHCGVGVGWG